MCDDKIRRSNDCTSRSGGGKEEVGVGGMKGKGAYRERHRFTLLKRFQAFQLFHPSPPCGFSRTDCHVLDFCDRDGVCESNDSIYYVIIDDNRFCSLTRTMSTAGYHEVSERCWFPGVRVYALFRSGEMSRWQAYTMEELSIGLAVWSGSRLMVFRAAHAHTS